MKRFAILLVCFVFAAALSAQNMQDITKSPLEGFWFLESEDYRGSEFVFFGNVMLMGFQEEYEGIIFTFDSQTLYFPEEHEEWRYELSGNRLNITTEFDEQFSFTRTAAKASPIEGIWKITGGTFFDPGEITDGYFIIFTGNVMGAIQNGDCEGIRVTYYKDNYLLEHYDEIDLADMCEEDIILDAMHYIVSGKTLTLTFDTEGDVIMKKVY